MNKFAISCSPHISSPMDTRHMMQGVITALIPAGIAALYFYRISALFVIMTAMISCVATEFVIQKLRRRTIRIYDRSAALTGLLLALVLPPATPLWMAFLAGVFAIAIGKEIFGGIGFNIFNPALLARAFLMAAFPVTMTTWSKPLTLDAITTATPLGLAKFEQLSTSYFDLILGNIGGSIGETSAIALILGGGYLLFRKIIDFRIPAAYIGTVVVFSSITHIISPGTYFPPVFHVLAGGLLIGAFFMATDPVTSPVTSRGRWIFGAGCGMVTMIIRFWGGLPEGVMYSILFMNAVTPLINRMTRPKRYGLMKAI